MTDLEQQIYDNAMIQIPKLRLRLRESKAKYLLFLVSNGQCYDRIYYDTDIKAFTRIEYSYGLGEGVINKDVSDNALFNDFELRTIEINIK